MTYKINKTNGEVLSTVLDGSYDNKSSSLTLIGKNSVNFGEVINENFVRLLENFTNESQPEHAIKGQLWYDSASDRLNVYNGSTFVNTTGTIVQSSKPTTNVGVGDTWLDSTNLQLHVCDSISTITGPSFRLVGPIYSAVQNTSGFVIKSIIGADGAAHVVSVVYVGNTIVGFYSKDTFTQSATSPFRIEEFTGTVQPGYNAVINNSSGIVIKSITGTDGLPHVVSIVYVDGSIVGFYSKDTFTQSSTSPFKIEAFTGPVQPGYNAVLGS